MFKLRKKTRKFSFKSTPGGYDNSARSKNRKNFWIRVVTSSEPTALGKFFGVEPEYKVDDYHSTFNITWVNNATGQKVYEEMDGLSGHRFNDMLCRQWRCHKAQTDPEKSPFDEEEDD